MLHYVSIIIHIKVLYNTNCLKSIWHLQKWPFSFLFFHRHNFGILSFGSVTFPLGEELEELVLRNNW